MINLSQIFCALLLLMGVNAQITVDFANPYGEKPLTPEVNPVLNTGEITLTFLIDESGSVTLHSIPANPASTPYFDSIQGVVGQVADSALWDSQVDLLIQLEGGDDIRISKFLTGLSVRGQNQHRIDKDGEGLRFTLSDPALQLSLQGIGYDAATTTAPTALDLDDTSYTLMATKGEVDTSEQAVGHSFLVSSANDGNNQGFTLSSLTFSLAVPTSTFDAGAQLANWREPLNWSGDRVPANDGIAIIDGGSVYIDQRIYHIPRHLAFHNGSLELRESADFQTKSFEMGTDIVGTPHLTLHSDARFAFYNDDNSNQEFELGSVATLTMVPTATATPTIELGSSQLTIAEGAVWFLDGSEYTGDFLLGERFTLANFGTFSGSLLGISFGNFQLPADKELRLVQTDSSLYYEVVAQNAATGPNIIVVYLDDLAAGHYFGFESDYAYTPTVDSMVDNGLSFQNAFTSSTVCAPSRYTLLTGRFASRGTSPHFLSHFPAGELARFHNTQVELEHDGQNIGAWLQQVGYRTGFVGKCHTLDHDISYVKRWESLGLKTYEKTDDPALLPEVNGAMLHNYRVMAQRMRAHGFDYVDGYFVANTLEFHNDKLNQHHQEFVTEHALEFIDQNHSQRFFLHMAPTIDHGPTRHNLSFSLRTNKDYTPEGYRPGADYSFMPERDDIISEVNELGYSQPSTRITWVDYSMQSILDRLEQYGIKDNTLIVFTADHGGNIRSGQTVYNGKTTCYDDGAKIPLVYYWPGGITDPGRVVTEMTSNEDFVPTCLDLAGGLDLPNRTLDGVSLKPFLDGQTAPLKDELYCEIGYMRSIRTKEWKYIAIRYTPLVYRQIEEGYKWRDFFGNYVLDRPYNVINNHLGHYAQIGYPNYYDTDQFYDLNADPGERDNIYGQYPAVAYDLKGRLSDYMSAIPNRPFRKFDNPNATEFSPAPAAAPLAPQSFVGQLTSTGEILFTWTDQSITELGFVLEQSLNGGPYGVVAETPADTSNLTLPSQTATGTAVYRLFSYNLLGDTEASDRVTFTVTP